MNDDKYLGESPLSEQPLKKLGLVIADGAVTFDKLSDDVKESIFYASGLATILENIGHAEQFKGTWVSDYSKTYVKYDTVYYMGCKWMCIVDSTNEEITWNSKDWIYLTGDKDFTLQIQSSKGNTFRNNNVDTEISVRIYFGSFDITDKIIAQSGVVIKWTRDTDNASEDKAWTPEYLDSTLLKIKIRNYDVGNYFFVKRIAQFTITISIPTSVGIEVIEQVINIK